MSTFADEVREIAARYPDSRSAVLPALRVAQERHDGWLPPEAFVEVADALELTPAYCQAVATFYDMYNLAPTGKHSIEVCTNLSCALAKAQDVVEAFEEVADALDLTPAYCQAVATFYDMYHLAPVGKHLVEVCTNLSCALARAQDVVDAFESELGIRAGETTEDGEITFRVVECLGGCGYAPVVAVDHRYRHDVKPDDAAGIVEELRAGS